MISPAQVHAQQDIGPVLRLSTARTGLDVEVSVIGIHFAAEHTTKLQLGQNIFQTGNFAAHVLNGLFVLFLNSHFQQLRRIRQAAVQIFDGFYNLRQLGTLAAQILRIFWIVPDGWVFQFALDLY